MNEQWVFKSHEVNFQGQARPDALLARLSDLAKRHADQLGFGYHDMKALGYFWVVRRVQILIHRVPRLDEVLDIETDPALMKSIRARRQMLISAGGEVLVSCDTEWVLLSWEEKRPTPVYKVLMPLPETRILFDNKSVMPDITDFPALLPSGGGHLLDTRTARYSDIDLHEHVNNSRYLTWSHDPVPRQEWEKAYPHYIDITFKKETCWGDSVEIQEMRETNRRCVEGYTTEGVPVFTLLEEWR